MKTIIKFVFFSDFGSEKGVSFTLEKLGKFDLPDGISYEPGLILGRMIKNDEHHVKGRVELKNSSFKEDYDPSGNGGIYTLYVKNSHHYEKEEADLVQKEMIKLGWKK